MANTQAFANSFKPELLSAIHAFGTTVARGGTGADTFKAALYLASATINASSTAYTVTGEVSGAGYTAGGINVTNATAPSLSGTTGIWTPSASLAFGTVTLASSFDCCMFYNSTQANRMVAAFTFTAQTVAAAAFSLNMPANAAATALIRLN